MDAIYVAVLVLTDTARPSPPPARCSLAAAFERAVTAGATARMPPADMFWGDRFGAVTDPFGHSWSIATHVKDVSTAEAQAAASGPAACAENALA